MNRPRKVSVSRIRFNAARVAASATALPEPAWYAAALAEATPFAPAFARAFAEAERDRRAAADFERAVLGVAAIAFRLAPEPRHVRRFVAQFARVALAADPRADVERAAARAAGVVDVVYLLLGVDGFAADVDAVLEQLRAAGA
jgi:hypothetical protein